MDHRVLDVQLWLNTTYFGRAGFVEAPENGKTGWSTIYSLTRALQLELGITNTADSFGPTTEREYIKFGILEMDNIPDSDNANNILLILQGAMYCKGYDPGGFDFRFDQTMKDSIIKLQTDAGLPVRDGKVYAYIFKAFLTMDAYKLTYNGSEKTRGIQQELNRKYFTTSGIQPCDGHYQRGTNKALVYGLQTEMDIPASQQTGSVGPATREGLPTLNTGSSGQFVKLFQYALYFNDYDSSPFNGIYDSNLRSNVTSFQSFTLLDADGIAGKQTWLSALISTGDPNRRGKAADCVTTITPDRAQTLVTEGYETVGRYLTSVIPTIENPTPLNKKIQAGELATIFNAGLTVFPIYQTTGDSISYFSKSQGRKDGIAAHNAAIEHGFEHGSTIYFAVDFDVLGHEITNSVIPHFMGINEVISGSEMNYKVGVYGPRSICINVSENGLAESSFVSGMSTGYSGNLGYPLPKNWAFDQISTIEIGSGAGFIEIDNNIKSGRNLGASSVSPSIVPNKDFFEQLDLIYDIALNFADNDISKANKLVCQFYRAKVYYRPLWTPIAGALNQEFIDEVDISLRYPVREELVDPKYNEGIDTPHLFATLNSILFHKSTKSFMTDFAGWAGDLVTLAGEAATTDKYPSTYEAAFDMLGKLDESKSSFALEDLLADFDAINVGHSLINSDRKLNEVLNEYYISPYRTRYSDFLNLKFEGILDVFKSNCEYILNSTELGVFEIRSLFMSSFDVPSYSVEDGEDVARAFKEVLSIKISEQ